MANNNDRPEGNQGVNRPAQDPVFLAANHNIPMRNYAVPNLYDFSPEISRPIVEENARFEIKSVMVQMIQNAGQFGGLQGEDPHANLIIFVEICNTFSIPGVTLEGIRLYLFLYTLRDEAKRKVEKNKELEWEKAQKIEIGVDLVAAAKHQLQFLSEVDSIPFLHEGPSLDRAIYRYNAYWLPLLAKHSESPLFEGPLVVPLDCEWIWHSHRLNPVQYINDCEELYGKILDNSNVISTTMVESPCLIKETENIWNELYPEEPFSFNFNSQEADVPKDRQLSQLEKYTKYDLVLAVKRQTPFFYQVSQPHMKNENFLQEALARYRGFLYLIKSSMDESVQMFCVPTYDIDLIWHTHQLHPLCYCKDMKKLLGLVLEHDDTVTDRTVGEKLDIGFTGTTKQWDDTFGTSYSKIGAMYRGPAPRMQGGVKSGECKLESSGGIAAGCGSKVESSGRTATAGCGSKVETCGGITTAGCGSKVGISGGTTAARHGSKVGSSRRTTAAKCGSTLKSYRGTTATGCGSKVGSGGGTTASTCGSKVESDGRTTAAGCGSKVVSGGGIAAAGCGSKLENRWRHCCCGCGSKIESHGGTAGCCAGQV
ncbi:uncharacterized protein LOC120069217 [Benincasa hispida]|uniref:uncharacterized protein LOC120069217 n=1 Tax=Benincasa hispida TaxID=102211 RepID=UPI0019022D6D|nr:uncharacterized protein LOC120069217 [Benincasa hispida]